MKERAITLRLPESDHAILEAAAKQTHAGKVAPYVHTKAMEAARKELQLPPVEVASSGGLTREGAERLMATLNGAQDRRQA